MLGPDVQDCGLARAWAPAIRRCRKSTLTEGEERQKDAAQRAPPLTRSNPGESTRAALVLQQVGNWPWETSQVLPGFTGLCWPTLGPRRPQ